MSVTQIPGYTFHGYKGYACDGCGVYVHDPALHDLHCPQKLAEAAFKRQQEIYRREAAGYVEVADPSKTYTINEMAFEPQIGVVKPHTHEGAPVRTRRLCYDPSCMDDTPHVEH